MARSSQPMLDGYASEPHYLANLSPVWRALPANLRGALLVPDALIPLAGALGCEAEPWRRGSSRYALCAAYRDLPAIQGWAADGEWGQPTILMEHGAGQCLAPETLVLTADLHHVPVSSLSVGDRLVAFDEDPVTRGPGRGNRWRRWQTATVTAIRLLRLPCYELHFEDGSVIVASEGHRWLARDRQMYEWTKTENLQDAERWPTRSSKVIKCFDTWDEDVSWGAGYLAAAFDGEGCFTQTTRDGRQNRVMLVFSQKENGMLAEVERELTVRGFSFRCHKHDDSGAVALNVKGGTREVLRFIGSIRPRRLLDNMKPMENGQMRGLPVELMEKRFIGEQTVVGLETSTGTLIAEGFASHNSYGGDPAAETARHVAYAGGLNRESVILFLNPGPHPAQRNAEAYPDAQSVEIGSPFLDELRAVPSSGHEATVGFAWHFNAEVCPESMSGFPVWGDATLQALSRSGFRVIATCHPRAMTDVAGFYSSQRVAGESVLFVPDFGQFVAEADILVTDQTSAGFFWDALGRPVISLNNPDWRRSVRHGLRFWDAVPGQQVDDLAGFEDAMASIAPQGHLGGKPGPAARAAFSFFGDAAKRAAKAIVDAIVRAEAPEPAAVP